MNKLTLEDWDSQGMNSVNGQSFAEDIHSITSMALFVRALPGWVENHKTGVKITIECEPGMGGATVNIGFDQKNLNIEAAQEFLERLTMTSRLMELESHVELLRGSGGNIELIERLVNEADDLAERLHPTD